MKEDLDTNFSLFLNIYKFQQLFPYMQGDLLKILREKNFSKNIIDAFAKVDREKFVPYRLRGSAWQDGALPIGEGQTISQPSTIAIELGLLELKKGQKVLEVGSGSGYVLALMSELVGKSGKVYGIELLQKLFKKSKENLEDGYDNVRVYHANGSRGLQEKKATFDRIIISAAVHKVPRGILNQLKEGGILVAPEGSRFEQELIVIQREGNEFRVINRVPGFVFVAFVEE